MNEQEKYQNTLWKKAFFTFYALSVDLCTPSFCAVSDWLNPDLINIQI